LDRFKLISARRAKVFGIGRKEKKPDQHWNREGGVWRPGQPLLAPTARASREDRQRSPERANTMTGLHVVSILLTGAVAVLATLYLVGPRPEELRGGGPDEPQTTSQATPTPTPDVQPSYDGPFEAGQTVRIVNTGSCLNIRTYPGVSAPVWSCVPDGSELRLVLGPIYSDTMWWWAAERQGWVAQPYLSPAVAGEEEPLIAQGIAARYQPQDDRKPFAREP
jgi:hypothetical protein